MANPNPEGPLGGNEAEAPAPHPAGGTGEQPNHDRGDRAVDPASDPPPGKSRPSPRSGRGSPLRPALPLALRLRRAHAALAPWVLAPLLLTVSTGLGYRLLRDWGGLDRDAAHGLMVLHEGEWLRHWLGPSGETLYVLANGLGLLWMLGTGGAMLWQRWRHPGDRARGDT